MKGTWPLFGRAGYVAVTESDIAVVKGKSGLFKPRIGNDVWIGQDVLIKRDVAIGDGAVIAARHHLGSGGGVESAGLGEIHR